MKIKRECWISWNWITSSCTPTPIWVLGVELGFFGRVANAFNYWAISPLPHDTSSGP